MNEGTLAAVGRSDTPKKGMALLVAAGILWLLSPQGERFVGATGQCAGATARPVRLGRLAGDERQERAAFEALGGGDAGEPAQRRRDVLGLGLARAELEREVAQQLLDPRLRRREQPRHQLVERRLGAPRQPQRRT